MADTSSAKNFRLETRKFQVNSLQILIALAACAPYLAIWHLGLAE